MDIRETQNEYQKLGSALQAIVKGFDPRSSPHLLRSTMDRVLEHAHNIGSPLLEEVQELKELFDRLLAKSDQQLADRFLKQALRLEQETREI